MKKRRIIFRVDGGTEIGMGHVVRCVALADMLKNDFAIAFAVQQTTETILNTVRTVANEIMTLPQTTDYSEDALNFSPYLRADDIVVLDGYHFKTGYQKTIREEKCKLVCIDDLHKWHFLADAVINHADGIDENEYSAEPFTQLYLGLDYVLLRNPFLKRSSIPKKINAVKKVFISMGAADINNITQKFAETLLQIKGIENIHLLLGSINPNLKSIENLISKNKEANIHRHVDLSAGKLEQLLQECDVAICPASTISLECCAVGMGLISGYTSENQSGILKGLTKHSAAIDFGNLNVLRMEDIKNNFEKLIEQPEIVNELIKNQKKLIDGKSPERLVDIFNNFVEL